MTPTTEQLIAALQPIISRVRTDVTAIKVPEGGSRWVNEPLTKARLVKHIEGGLPRGCCPIKAGEAVTSLALLDLDSHKGAVTWAGMSEVARRITDACSIEGVTLIPFRSSGGKGMHLFALWDAPQDAYSVRQFFVGMLAAVGMASGTKGVQDGEVEVFPKQNNVPLSGYGNQFILPLAGASEPLDFLFEPLGRHAVCGLQWPISDPVPIVDKPPAPVFTGALTHDFKQLQAHLAAIPNAEGQELDYDQWRNIIFAIHHETAGSDAGLALAHEFSSRASKYDPDLLDNRIWPYITSDRDSAITGKTIGFMAREHGYVEDVTDDFDVVQEAAEFTDRERDKKLNKFQPIHASTFTDAPETKWLVKGVLPAGDQAAVLAVMYGASGSGKSFQATDMACAIARGVPWRDHRVTQGRVVYVCAEGAGGYRKRLRAYCKHHGLQIEDLDVWVVPAAPNLLQGDDVRALIGAIKAIGPVALVIVDTLAQATAGGNENSGEVMGQAISHCRTMSEVLRCSVMLIHHSGKNADMGARGHSSLKAAADTELEVLRSEKDKDMRSMRVSKQKDGEEVPDMGFDLHVVELGKDTDGDSITSCVVVSTETTVADIRASSSNSTKGKGPQQVLIISTLEDMQGLSSVENVPFEDLVAAVVAKIPAPDDEKEDRRARQTRSKIHKLIKDGLLSTANGCVGTC